MRAGLMRQVVDVLEPSTTTKDTGEVTYSYSVSTGKSKLFAWVKQISQYKTEDGMIQGSGTDLYRVSIRYDSDITYNHQLDYYVTSTEKVRLKINQIDSPRQNRTETDMVCEVVGL